jgi:hypothetical protein
MSVIHDPREPGKNVSAWRLVDEVWNCVAVRRRIHNVIGALWNEKKRRLGYDFL